MSRGLCVSPQLLCLATLKIAACNGGARPGSRCACARHVDLVHIHTPFIAHYAGLRFARDEGYPLRGDVSHVLRGIPAPLRAACCHARSGGTWRALSHARNVDDVQALIAPSEPMRDVLLEYGVTVPFTCIPTGLPADRFCQGDGEVSDQAAAAGRSSVDDLHRPGGAREEHRVPGAGVRQGAPAGSGSDAGDRRRGARAGPLRQLVERLGLERDVHFAGYLDRNTGLLDCYAAAERVCFRLAHGDAGPRAPRGHGAGRAGRIDRGAGHPLHTKARLRRADRSRSSGRISPPRWSACCRTNQLQRELAERGRTMRATGRPSSWRAGWQTCTDDRTLTMLNA